MGTIKSEVKDLHLSQYPQEEDWLRAFLSDFEISWGRRRRSHNTDLSVYFLQPEPHIAETYDFQQQLLLVYSGYKTMEPRTIQAAESFITDDPGKGRVEKLNYILVSEMPNVQEWVEQYTATNQESRIIIAFYADDLRKNKADAWFVRNTLNRQLYNRDLFDFRLPLERDTYFFGRRDLIKDYIDAIKRSENRGLFGLRKTGKTSFLFKLERMLQEDNVATVLYYDCKSPSIRKLRWFNLVERISNDISGKTSISSKEIYNELSAADSFTKLVSKLTKPCVIIFDEIEYISPINREDQHWPKDFVDFWQMFWASQSRHRKISTIIAGVNPSVVEIDVINEIQNPLFGIVSYKFLRGLGYDEMNRMIRTLGKRMGIHFEPEAVKYMHERYGGHPLLTRISCSLINSKARAKNEKRPISLSRPRLLLEEEERDSDLVFYCRHVVSELKQFYPEEYEMLELLASGQTNDFVELSLASEFTKHLESYGLLSKDGNNIPLISIPVISRYIGLELARREGRKTIYKVIKTSDRLLWLDKRLQSIMRDIRFLEKLIDQAKTSKLFGTSSFPEADALIKLKPCETEADFSYFINILNRCFVESLENHGKSLRKNDYFWKEIKNDYPGLWFALNRVKVYRNNHMHLILNPNVNEQLIDYLRRDLEGRKPSQVEDLFFVLQQCVLDGLLTGIQIEVNKFS